MIVMGGKAFFRYFPVPKYLKFPAVGLDISDGAVKYVEILGDKGEFKIGRYGKVEIGVSPDDKEYGKALASAILKVKKENNFETARASLLEDQSYFLRIKIPKIKKSEVRGSIELQLEEYIPYPPAEVVFDYEILGEAGGEFIVSVAVFPLKEVEERTNLLKSAGLLPVSLEAESEAVARALIPKGEKGAHMLVNLGREHSILSITDGKNIYFSHIMKVGGNSLNKKIRECFSVGEEEAEKIKFEKGLIQSKENQELIFCLAPSISSVRDEIVKHLRYWESHDDVFGKREAPIKKIILFGNQAGIPGLADYLSASIGQKIVLGSPWINIFKLEKYVPEIPAKKSLEYATAVGLAMGDLSFMNE